MKKNKKIKKKELKKNKKKQKKKYEKILKKKRIDYYQTFLFLGFK